MGTFANFVERDDYMIKADLFQYIGQEVIVKFKDGKEINGILGFTYDFSEKYNFRKPGYFTVGHYDFKVSYIRSIIVLN